jgi:hypothetical protein
MGSKNKSVYKNTHLFNHPFFLCHSGVVFLTQYLLGEVAIIMDAHETASYQGKFN